MRGAVEKLCGDSALNGSEALKHSHPVTGTLVAAVITHKEEQAMGLLSAFVKGKLLQKALGRLGGAAHPGRSRGGLFGMLIAGAAAMLLKRAFRR
jgi:hypothetical protein